jgi:hypothetical protein
MIYENISRQEAAALLGGMGSEEAHRKLKVAIEYGSYEDGDVLVTYDTLPSCLAYTVEFK